MRPSAEPTRDGEWVVTQDGQSVLIGCGYEARADAEADATWSASVAPQYEWAVCSRTVQR